VTHPAPLQRRVARGAAFVRRSRASYCSTRGAGAPGDARRRWSVVAINYWINRVTTCSG